MTSADTSALRSYMSDNAAGTPPEILASMAQAAGGLVAPYGNDPFTERLRAQLADVFEHPVEAFPVSTGTAANGLALAALTPPWKGVLTHQGAHINNDEAGGPEFFTGSSKLIPLPGEDSKIAVSGLKEIGFGQRGDVHGVPPAVLSLTQATESGSIYSIDELAELSAIAHEEGLRVHMDGARFANALVALGVTPAEMSWKAGIDVLSFGATKNGTMTADVVVSFDPQLAEELAHRHKRAGQLTSKMRFQSAQLNAYLSDDLWLRSATHANAMCARLRDGLQEVPGVEILVQSETNILFCRLPAHIDQGLREQGFAFYGGRWAPGVVRLVTSYAHQSSDIDLFIVACADLAGGTALG